MAMQQECLTCSFLLYLCYPHWCRPVLLMSASTSALNRRLELGKFCPWLTSLSAVLFRSPPTLSGVPFPWLASKEYQVPDWNPPLLLLYTKQITVLPVLCTWPITEKVYQGNIWTRGLHQVKYRWQMSPYGGVAFRFWWANCGKAHIYSSTPPMWRTPVWSVACCWFDAKCTAWISEEYLQS